MDMTRMVGGMVVMGMFITGTVRVPFGYQT
jgi:hypothetical protein